MLTCYTRSAALALNGEWTRARPEALRAIDILETEPALRDDPRYLVIALLAAGWANEPALAMSYMDRRIGAARARGAIGVLPLALQLIATAAITYGQHELSYACAGEVVELGTELGYVVEVGSASSTLAIQSAHRGRHDDAVRAIAEAKRLLTIAGVFQNAVMVHLAEAYCAICRGDFPTVVDVLERRIAIDDGRMPRGDYPLFVAPDLIEAYLALGRQDAAKALAARHHQLHSDSGQPDIRAIDHRISGMVEDDENRADESFRRAHEEHAQGLDPLEAARTRLLHGSRLRRAGQRTAAREQLRLAAEAFRSMGLDAWTERAENELAATGSGRRTAAMGDALTSQETRVALLVTRGQTNRDIAAALFLSPKTVEHHLTTILRKRGLRSRTELAVSMTGAG
jgi:DNA-binding CsgD family transcriptional regulator